MAGGLLNLVAYGNKNIILNGNPSKTFFKTTYAKYTNFGMQKFRIEFDGQKTLRENTNSFYEFTIPLYGDFLMDTYFVINMPNIWSPIYCPNVSPPCKEVNSDCFNNLKNYVTQEINEGQYTQPYEFKWIENLGSQLIKNIRYTIGGKIIQEFSGDYLYNMVQRDFSKDKKDLFDKMTGNTGDMNDPANYTTNNGNYPNYLGQSLSCDPSIRGKKLYIPLNIWSTLSAKLSIPLVCLQKNQLKIQIECRPIRELFVIRDINEYISTQWDVSANALGGLVYNTDVSYSEPPYISSMNIVDPKYQLYLFLNQIQNGDLNNLYPSLQSSGVKFDASQQSNWYADPHLVTTYGFISKEEIREFVENPPSYLIKQINEYSFHREANKIEKIRVKSNGLISSWMWYFRRDDVYLRNEWSNYTNWPYNYMPYPCVNPYDLSNNLNATSYKKPCPPKFSKASNNLGPNCFPYTPYSKYNDPSGCIPQITGPARKDNTKNIMNSWSLIIDGSIREKELPGSVLNTVEKYVRTAGNGKDGLYCYNFSLNTDPFQYQPSGAMNLSKVRHCDWEYGTFRPVKDISSQLLIVCDENDNMLGYNKPYWNIHKYDFYLHIMEERYNLITFENNNVRLEHLYN